MTKLAIRPLLPELWPALEAYPLDRELTPSATSTGIASTFERAGFQTVARHVPPRPIMRYDLRTRQRLGE